MTTKEENCAKIEQYIKSMIFSSDNDSLKSASSLPSSSPFGNNTLPFKLSNSVETNLLHSGLQQSNNNNNNNNDNRLIDSEALMRFVSEHMQDPVEPLKFGGMDNSLLSVSPTKDNPLNRSSNLMENPLLDSSIIEMSPISTIVDDQSSKSWPKKKKKRKKGKTFKDKDLKAQGSNFQSNIREDWDFSEPIFSGDYLFGIDDGCVYSVCVMEDGLHLDCYICSHNELSNRGQFTHLFHTNHEKNLKKFQREFTLMKLPPPLPVQNEVISDVIYKLHEEFGLSEHQLSERKFVWGKVNKLISENLPDCQVELIGSSVSGCGLRDSEVDMALIINRHLASERLEQTYSLLLKSEFVDVVNKFQEKIPKVTFRDEKINLHCNVTLLDIKSCPLIHILLTLYNHLDVRMWPLLTTFRYFARICDLDKPDMGTLPPLAYPLLLIYFLQKQDPPVLPVLHEVEGFDLNGNYEKFLSTFRWSSKNTESVASLWIKLLKFYCFVYKPGEEIVSIQKSKAVLCADKGWGTKFLAIEDPIEPSRNLAHTIPNKILYTYIMNTFMHTYQYFAYPRLTTDSFKIDIVEEKISDTNTSSNVNDVFSESTEATESVNCEVEEELLEDHDEDLPLDDVISTISKLTIDDIKIDEDHESYSDLDESTYKSPLCSDSVSSLFSEHNKENYDIKNSVRSLHKCIWNTNGNVITKDLLKYEFNKENFLPKEGLPLICRGCNKQGHLKKDCPMEKLPNINELPPLPVENLRILDKICNDVKSILMPSQITMNKNEEERVLLEKIIRGTYEDAELTLFGSFCNGFGFENSDLDFCLTFKNNKTGEGLVFPDIIQNLAAKFQHYSFLHQVTPIVSAKVPILKFTYIRYGQRHECDISLYNTLAQHNTKMLQMYCSIDERVQVIGYVIKKFAKELDICDASKGSLSSYAYILMAIYYLQQCKPPVLPVLQELFEDEKPIHMVDDWNVWFFNDITKLKKVWPGYGENHLTVGQLWLGLLHFYASEFNFMNHVISIKQKEPLTRFKKLWQSKKIAIEDPFDLNHNLGAGLSGKMSHYIRKSFIYAREHFGKPCPWATNSIKELMNYYFDSHIINKGTKPPQDRVCRGCKKIGHFYKDCPTHPKNRKNYKKFPYHDKYTERNQSPQKGFKEAHNKNKNMRPIGKNHYQHRHPQAQKSEPSYKTLPHNDTLMGMPPINMKAKNYPPVPPGFNSHIGNNFMGQVPLSFAARPRTLSPFPHNTGGGSGVRNISVPMQPSRMPLPNTSNFWPSTVHSRSDANYRSQNNPNHRRQNFPNHNHGMDQSNRGLSYGNRGSSLQQQSRNRTASQQDYRTHTEHRW